MTSCQSNCLIYILNQHSKWVYSTVGDVAGRKLLGKLSIMCNDKHHQFLPQADDSQQCNEPSNFLHSSCLCIDESYKYTSWSKFEVQFYVNQLLYIYIQWIMTHSRQQPSWISWLSFALDLWGREFDSHRRPWSCIFLNWSRLISLSFTFNSYQV